MSRANIVEEARGNEVTKKGRSARRLAEELRREDEDQEEEKGEEEEEEEEEEKDDNFEPTPRARSSDKLKMPSLHKMGATSKRIRRVSAVGIEGFEWDDDDEFPRGGARLPSRDTPTSMPRRKLGIAFTEAILGEKGRILEGMVKSCCSYDGNRPRVVGAEPPLPTNILRNYSVIVSSYLSPPPGFARQISDPLSSLRSSHSRRRNPLPPDVPSD